MAVAATPLVHDGTDADARARAEAVGLPGDLPLVVYPSLREAAPALRAGGQVLGACTEGLPDVDKVRGHLLYGELDEAEAALEVERARCAGGEIRGALERSAGVLAMLRGDEAEAAAAFATAKGFDPTLEWDPGFPADHQAVFDAATPSTTDLTVVPSALARIDGGPQSGPVARGVHGVSWPSGGVAVRLTVADDELVMPSAFPATLPALGDDAARAELSSLLAVALGEGRRVAVVGPEAVWSGTTGRVDWDRLVPQEVARSKRSPAPWVLAAGGGAVSVVGAVLMGTGLGAAQRHAGTMEGAASRSAYDTAADDYDRAAGQTRAGYGLTGAGLGAVLIGVGWGVAR